MYRPPVSKQESAVSHTPGPWSVTAECDNDVAGANNELIAVACCLVDDFGELCESPEQGANASLIATAPDGLALAKHILALQSDPYLREHPEWEAFLNEAETLIIKANGKCSKAANRYSGRRARSDPNNKRAV